MLWNSIAVRIFVMHLMSRKSVSARAAATARQSALPLLLELNMRFYKPNQCTTTLIAITLLKG
jgi:hypothetical protein